MAIQFQVIQRFDQQAHGYNLQEIEFGHPLRKNGIDSTIRVLVLLPGPDCASNKDVPASVGGHNGQIAIKAME